MTNEMKNEILRAYAKGYPVSQIAEVEEISKEVVEEVIEENLNEIEEMKVKYNGD